MPRQRRGAAPTPARSAPTRPTAAAPPPAQTQHRPSSTAAAPSQTAPAQQAPPAQAASQGPGLFGQMASTAAGVAVGSSIGHAVGSFFTGGSSSAPAEQAQASPAAPMDNSMYQSNSSSWGQSPACETDIKAFRSCMDQHSGNMSICGWYLDQLKACQEAAKQY